ncbi:MAG: hydantoinase B/oxoprolinase family protein [Thermoleophilia bacterium]
MAALGDAVLTTAGKGRSTGARDADPITTEVVRHGLNSAANQIKRALIRTSFSPVIYEVLDFAAVVYDRHFRMLAQAPSLPAFMGTMSFCIEAAVERVGGVEALDPGDILLINDPYASGSHPQDAAMVMPVFLPDATLIGYTAIKGHWLDIGALAPYCTNTKDVYQEGVVFPGVKLFARGELVRDIYRMILANTRMPMHVAGDVNAEVVGLRTGAAALVRLVERFGLTRFDEAVERMYDHGEAVVRATIERIPDGRYVGRGSMDSDGLTDDPVPFEVTVEIDGSTARLDFTNAPPATAGPVNCPLPMTMSAARVVFTFLAGGGESPNEGHFRPIEIVTRPGSMFHPQPPSPCYLFGWSATQAADAALRALGEAVPELVPADSAGDICALVWWGRRERTGEFWGDGSAFPSGQGAGSRGDGGSSQIHFMEAATRIAPAEVWEAKNPWVFERIELAPDSGGAGKHRGGLGVDLFFETIEDAWCTSTLERTKSPGLGLLGGGAGRPNSGTVRYPDGRREPIAKVTGQAIPRGAVYELRTGGGGGWGAPAERDPSAVHADVREGYVSEERARSDYPHAFA